MLGDLTEKVQASQSKFEELVSKIPGYGGYKQKEQRRDADKLLRLHVARQYEGQLAELNSLQYDLTMQGNLKLIVPLERAVMKLQLLIDRIKSASYGYAGLFDAVKVDEEALDRLYDFDMQMLGGVEEIEAKLAELRASLAEDGLTLADANGLVSMVERLNTTYSQRQDAILE